MQDYINFEYVNLNPNNMTGLSEFNQAFFDKIDAIENQVSKNINFSQIIKEFNLLSLKKYRFI